MRRREFNNTLTLALSAMLPIGGASAATQKSFGQGRFSPWPAIEAKVGGRLGVAVLDTATGRTEGHRLDERFPMCSTFKWLVAALVLQRVDAGQERLQNRIRFGPDVLLGNSPVTEQHVGGDGMTLAALCEAAVTRSDNAAANLLLQRFGGPAALTRYARTLGDTRTRLDRNEPTMSAASPGDPRDTTTPRAMSVALRTAVLGDALSDAGRAQLVAWMEATQTGHDRLRAGLPAGWRAADKTGSGDHGTSNDVAVFWPPQRAPRVVTAYLTESSAPQVHRHAALAEVGRVVVASLG